MGEARRHESYLSSILYLSVFRRREAFCGTSPIGLAMSLPAAFLRHKVRLSESRVCITNIALEERARTEFLREGDEPERRFFDTETELCHDGSSQKIS